jgi:hypothetical protein
MTRSNNIEWAGISARGWSIFLLVFCVSWGVSVYYAVQVTQDGFRRARTVEKRLHEMTMQRDMMRRDAVYYGYMTFDPALERYQWVKPVE